MTLVRVAGTVSPADLIHARVQQLQQKTWAQQDAQLQAAQQRRASAAPQWRAPVPPQTTAPITGPIAPPQPFVDAAWRKPHRQFETHQQIKFLKELGDLRASGVLVESEFVTFKKRVLS